MICPHCGFDNPEGRKFCRGCTKPLTPAPAVASVAPAMAAPPPLPPIPSSATPTSPESPKLNRLAMASFGLSMLGFIPPIGIASVVMGHISRKQIAASGGRETGGAYALLGLVLSYGQMFLMVLICWLLVVLAREINQKIPDGPTVQSFLLDRILNGNPNHPSASQAAQQQEKALSALRMIAARQESYQAEHPQGNAFACDLNELTPGFRDDEVWVRIRAANYVVKLTCRMTVTNGVAFAEGWQATAYPRAEGTSEAIYCLDESKTIRRYRDEGLLGVMTPYAARTCPDGGEPVE